MKGWYTYSYAIGVYPRVVTTKYTMRVEVVGETKKSYQVKYLEPHANRAAVGSLSWVMKKSVKLDEAAVDIKPPREDIRLPYKD